MISLIWAQDENGLIGAGGRLPWRLPADMAWFRARTMGKPILMGRKTYESIGRPLPGRLNIVLTSKDIHIEGCNVAHSLADVERILEQRGLKADELMVIGGARIYRQFLPRADRLYITQIHHRFTGDTWFPSFDRARWREVFREDHPADDVNLYPYSFLILERA